MSTTKKNTAEKKEFKLEQVFAMWKQKSKNGNAYFSGRLDGAKIRGFYNTNKKNPKEPDIRIYGIAENGDLTKEEIISLWCNATKNGKKILSGQYMGKRVVGFINSKATEENKMPYFSVYWSEDQEQESKPEKETKKAKKEEAKFEEIKTDDDLPF